MSVSPALEISSLGSIRSRFLSLRNASVEVRYLSTSPAIEGIAATRAVNCSTMSGTRKTVARARSPTTSKNESRIARPRGMRRERKRTGNERTRARAKPPMVVVSALGTRHTTSKTTSAAKINAARTRLEIRIGVGRAATA